MMKDCIPPLQIQGYNECLPTALSMLIGVPKDEFIEAALLGTPYTFWAEVANEKRSGLIKNALTYYGLDWPGIQLERPGRGPIDLQGKTGLIYSFDTRPDRREGHVAALIGNVVLDPCSGYYSSLGSYLFSLLIVRWAVGGFQSVALTIDEESV